MQVRRRADGRDWGRWMERFARSWLFAAALWASLLSALWVVAWGRVPVAVALLAAVLVLAALVRAGRP